MQGRSLNRDPKLYHKHFQILQDLGTKAYLQPLSTNENWSSWSLWSENASRPPTSSLPFQQPVNLHSTTLELQGIREKTFGLLASDPDPRARDQYLQQLLNSTVEGTPQIQFMLNIGRSTAVAYQHLLEKFLHLLTNLVLMHASRHIP